MSVLREKPVRLSMITTSWRWLRRGGKCRAGNIRRERSTYIQLVDPREIMVDEHRCRFARAQQGFIFKDDEPLLVGRRFRTGKASAIRASFVIVRGHWFQLTRLLAFLRIKEPFSLTLVLGGIMGKRQAYWQRASFTAAATGRRGDRRPRSLPGASERRPCFAAAAHLCCVG